MNLQNKFTDDSLCVTKNSWCNIIITAPIWLMEARNVQLVFYFLHLCTDSLLTFKTTILTCFGIYMLALLQMLFKSGRPFWDNPDITAYGQCKFDFSSPAMTTFVGTFIFPYLILMYFMKYNNNPNVIVTTILWVLFVFVMFEVCFTSYLLG